MMSLEKRIRDYLTFLYGAKEVERAWTTFHSVWGYGRAF